MQFFYESEVILALWSVVSRVFRKLVCSPWPE